MRGLSGSPRAREIGDPQNQSREQPALQLLS